MDPAQDLTRDYQNAAFIAQGDAFPRAWAEAAKAFRTACQPKGITVRLGLPYGPDPRQALDLFLPPGRPHGLFAFLHGGYWLAFGRADWSHLAAGALQRGWAVAVPSYRLAPQVRISAITQDVCAALQLALREVPRGPLVVAGHSAGGHLAARMANPDCVESFGGRLARVVPISPLSLLAPLRQTAMNRDLALDAAEALSESPALRPLAGGVAAHVVVGGQERPAFLWQARSLSEAWACPWSVLPGDHHFSVVAGLETAGSPLTNACLDGV